MHIFLPPLPHQNENHSSMEYKLVVMKQSQGCGVQHGEYSRCYCGGCVWCQVGAGMVEGDHFVIYVNVWPLCCVPETNIK